MPSTGPYNGTDINTSLVSNIFLKAANYDAAKRNDQRNLKRNILLTGIYSAVLLGLIIMVILSWHGGWVLLFVIPILPVSVMLGLCVRDIRRIQRAQREEEAFSSMDTANN